MCFASVSPWDLGEQLMLKLSRAPFSEPHVDHLSILPEHLLYYLFESLTTYSYTNYLH